MNQIAKLIVPRYLKVLLLVFAIAVLSANGASAAITFSGSSGNLSASASFDIKTPGLLEVVLTNTSTYDVLVPADVLTAVFFSINGVGTLTPLSALLNNSSTVLFGPDGGGNVGGEWEYRGGLAGAPGGAAQGISSSGFNLFGDANFNGPDLSPPSALNGLNYGITSAGDNPLSGNSKVTGAVPLIKNSVVFTLAGIDDSWTTADLLGEIEKVSFQYGTALTEPNVPGDGGGGGGGNPVPEPATMLLFGSGLVVFAGLGRKRLNSKHSIA